MLHRSRLWTLYCVVTSNCWGLYGLLAIPTAEWKRCVGIRQHSIDLTIEMNLATDRTKRRVGGEQYIFWRWLQIYVRKMHENPGLSKETELYLEMKKVKLLPCKVMKTEAPTYVLWYAVSEKLWRNSRTFDTDVQWKIQVTIRPTCNF